MTYMNINTVNYDDLDNQDLVSWLEERMGDDGFVFVTDGDESLQRDFDPVVLSLDEVLRDISPNEVIVFGDEAPKIDGFEKGVSYWGHSKLTKSE